jgi:hypothetical protein
MKPTVYIETTIISYLTCWPSRDIHRLSHEMLTHEWWRNHREFYQLVTSDFVIREAERGDPSAAAERMRALADVPVLAATSKVEELGSELATALQLPPRARLDALHLAISAVYATDFLLTWNCTHLANGNLTRKIEQACAKAGFRAPRILTPELLMESP